LRTWNEQFSSSGALRATEIARCTFDKSLFLIVFQKTSRDGTALAVTEMLLGPISSADPEAFDYALEERIVLWVSSWQSKTSFVDTLVSPVRKGRFWHGRLPTRESSRLWIMSDWAGCTSSLLNLPRPELSSSCCSMCPQERYERPPSCKGASPKTVWPSSLWGCNKNTDPDSFDG
jgi:hypothetical protein